MAIVSNCCGAPALGETDLCSYCKEHAEFYDEDVLQIDDLIEGKEYRIKYGIKVSQMDSKSVVFPKGIIVIYKGDYGAYTLNNWIFFETKDGIKIEMDSIENRELDFLEEIR